MTEPNPGSGHLLATLAELVESTGAGDHKDHNLVCDQCDRCGHKHDALASRPYVAETADVVLDTGVFGCMVRGSGCGGSTSGGSAWV